MPSIITDDFLTGGINMDLNISAKKITSVILAGVMLCGTAAFTDNIGFPGENIGSLTVSAADTGVLISGDFKYQLNTDGTATITAYNGSSTKITIPSKLDGKTVKAIGTYAFSNRINITSITVPKGVVTIGGGAFSRSTKLTSVSLPDTVTEIGAGAFSGCTGITGITLPDSVTVLGERAFSDCTGLKSFTVPKKVTAIKASVFDGCSALKTITIKDNVADIESTAFAGCSALTTINVSSGNKSFSASGGILFNKNKTKLVCCPRGKVGAYAIPKGVTAIGPAAFAYCVGLTDISIPDSVTEIGSYAFIDCEGLTEVTVPEKVKTLDPAAFFSCQGLKTVHIKGEISSISKYLFAECGSLESVVIPDSVTSIGEYAFLECRALTDISIPAGVREIGAYAFYTCTGLTEVSIPDGITAINMCTFSNCTKLTEINIPDSVTLIGENALFGCKALTAINVGENNKTYASIDGVLFSKDKKELILFPAGREGAYTVPDGVTAVGNYAFASCDSLTKVTLPGSVKTIGSGAFRACASMSSVSLPTGITSIGSGAFSGCMSLSVLYIPKSMKKIDSSAFFSCTSLKTVTIPKGVEEIGSNAFMSCGSLETVKIIGDTLTKIGDSAFAYCSSLKSITIPSSVTTISNMAFYNCSTMKKMDVPVTVKTIGYKAIGCIPGVPMEADPDFVICGQKDSQAEKYASRTGVAFRITSYPDKLTMSEKSKEIGLGETYVLKAIGGKGAAVTAEWTTSNKSVATVSGGKVTAKKTGTVTITAKSSTGKTATCKITVKAKPSKVTLSKSKKTLGVGEEYTLKVKFPDGSASGGLKWTSSSDVVIVDNGKLTAWRTGEATVTVRTYNGKTATCKITVKSAPSKVTLSKTRKTIGVGETYTLKATLPKGSASGTMKWPGSNDYLDVKNGVITGKKPGQVSVWVYTFNGKAANCIITIKNAPSKVTLSKTTLSMKKSGTYTLKATLPANTASGTMKWTTSDSSVVAVADGKLTAKKAGTATITVKTFNGKTAKCKVTVK